MAFSREVKVGIFVLIGVCLTGLVVFLIGDQRNLFSRKIDYETTFGDVQGLAAGAPVRMNGINVGTVSRVGHSDDLSDPRIHVELWVVRSEAYRLRKDAKAKVANKGLLGDKMLEIEPGSDDAPALGMGGVIDSENPTDLSNIVVQAGSIAERTNSVLGNLDKVTSSLADEKLHADLRQSVQSIRVILQEVSDGQGYVNRLLADPNEAERLSRTIAGFERTSQELAQVASQVNQLVTRMNKGPGFVHDLVYQQDGTQTIKSFGNVADEVALTLKGVREGSGMAKALLYGGQGPEADMVANLSAASDDLRQIMAGIKNGKGTLGALLVDPSVYEDIKLMLGNVQRNEVLRSLVRYSIKQDESRPKVEVKDSQAGSK